MKKIAFAVFAFVMLMSLWAGAEFAVNLSTAFIVSENGEILTATDEYSEIHALDGTSLYAARKISQNALVFIDRIGKLVCEDSFDAVLEAQGMLILQKDGMYALYDCELAPVTDFEYSYIIPSGSGFIAFKTRIWDDTQDIMYVLTVNGDCTPTSCRVQYAQFKFSQGLAAVMSAENGLFGYINAKAEWAIEPRYTSATDFCAGLAVVEENGEIYVIDTSGNIVLAPLDGSVRLSESYILNSRSDGLSLYRRNGAVIVGKREFNNAHGGLYGTYACIYTGTNSLLYDAEGKMKVAFGTNVLFYPDGDTLIAATKSSMFLYDLNTGMSSSYCYSVQRLKNGTLFRFSNLTQDNEIRFGFMNAQGKKLTEAVYEQICTTASGFAAAEKDGTVTIFSCTDDKLTEIATIEIKTAD